MFKKIIVAEDLDSINIAVGQALQDFSIGQIIYSKYCDEALLKIKKAIIDTQPFDLLITDLSFRVDHRDEKIKEGEALIAAVKKLQPDIAVIVYSMEDRSYKIKSLFNEHGINGYIVKNRTSIPELKAAIHEISKGKDRILSNEIAHVLNDTTLLEIEPYDIELLKKISKGFQQDDISLEFRNAGISPNSVSSIEKRINKLKIYFRAQNNVHLISITKDLGLI